MKTIVFVTSSVMTIHAFLAPHIRKLTDHYRIYVIVNSKGINLENILEQNVRVFHVPVSRTISIITDIYSFLKIYVLLKRIKPDLVFSITPKAGLLAMSTSRLLEIPLRVHFFTGQVWKTKTGLARWFLKLMDKIIVNCSNFVLVDSMSQRRFLLDQKIINEAKSKVLADGSVCGVNTTRFSPNKEIKLKVRKELGIPDNAFLFIFLGRLKLDKGILDLVIAFKNIAESYKAAYLLIIGPDEENILPVIRGKLEDKTSRCTFLDYTENPEKYLTSADVFCLPSYREGFGSVIIEAAACGIPAIGSHIYGIEDAIVDKETGLLFPAGDIYILIDCMKKMLDAPDYRLRLGQNAYNRAQELFAEERLTSAMLKFLNGMFTDDGVLNK